MPKSEHLEKRVNDILNGEYLDMLEKIANKPLAEIEELYNNRDMEQK